MQENNLFTIIGHSDSIGQKSVTFVPIDSIFTITPKESFKEKVDNVLGKDSYANLIATIALVITLVIFIIQTYMSGRAQKKNLKENWFLTVIVQPNLKNIESFYENTAELLSEEIKRIKRTNQQRITLEKAKANRKMQQRENDFFIYFVTLIQSYNSELANKVDATLNKLQDERAQWIDHYNDANIDDCKRKIYSNKSDLISILYSSISQN